MYPVEPYLKVLKNHVQSLARPMACMAEGYLKDECIGFITEYLRRFEFMQRRVWDEDEEYDDAEEVLQGVGKPYVMNAVLIDIAHQYVLTNASIVEELYAKWKVEQRVNASTPSLVDWIVNEVQNSDLDLKNQDDRDRLLLSRRPSQRTMRYGRITAFGNHFRLDDETSIRLWSYNSGVASVFQLRSENARDLSVNYVGVFKDRLLLDYSTLHLQIILL